MAMTPGDAVAGRTRTALVTGGTGGMGRVIAARLAADGFDVAVAYAGEMDLADATVDEIKAQGRRGLLVDDERAPDVDPVNRIEVSQVKVGQGDGVIDPGGMDNDIEVPELLFDGIENGRNRVGVGDVRREGRTAPAVPLISPTVASARSILPM